ncbi:MAG TPA: phosphatidylserine decarboxylase [Polyangia bacterium]|jgi:phosphatidylserine decarboxylase|nr:phosphatidylserine decarboxylase [Polyangia bacterium]
MDPVSFLFWRFHAFFRDPERHPPAGPVVLAPADGRVLYVSEVAPHTMPAVVKNGQEVPLTDAPMVGPDELPGVSIGIYMFPWSVHVNRAPIGGKVTHVNARPARHENRSMVRALMHLMWRLPVTDEVRASVADNARNTIVFEGALSVAMVQIADRYVRQVDCFVHSGETVERGQRVGMIRMGSQCDVFLRRTPGLEVLCRPGDRTRAGETILARY